MSDNNGAAIEVSGLVKTYGELTAVGGLDLRVERGTCLGLLGPNGAGKSTTIGVLVGLLSADSGTVRVLGLEWATDAARIREQIGVQLQETQINDKLQVVEVLRLFRSFYREGRSVDEVIALVGLEEKRQSRYVQLSGGQKQRLALGCALVSHPSILFLDEPTTGLDPQARRRVWEIVEDFKGQGGTVLLTTHYMDEAEQLSDYVVIVDHGRSIEEGTPREIIDRLGTGQIVEFTPVAANGETPSDLEPETLTQLPGFQKSRRDGNRVVLYVEATHSLLPALFEMLEGRGLALSDLRTHRPTLEDVFVERTGRQLRDG